MTSPPDPTLGADTDRLTETRFETLAAQMLERAERLEWGERVDGIEPASLLSFEDLVSVLWQDWTVAAREDVTVRHRGRAEASSLVAVVLLRHDRTGMWLVGEVTLTYLSQPGVTHMAWETMSNGGRVHAVASHLLNKSEDAPTIPALVQRVAEQIERLAGGDAPETQRRARCARLVLSLDPAAVADRVGERSGHDVAKSVAHEVASAHALAQLGGLGGIATLLAQVEKDHPNE